VGSFEGFKAQPFVTEVPNLALEKTKTNRKQVELPLGQEKEHNKTKQKGQVLKENGQKKEERKGQGQEEKGQRKRQQEPTSGVFRLTKALEKWYITTKNKQGKFVHVVSVYKKNCPRYAAIAQNMFDTCAVAP
jgi:hypothetical protein